MTDNSMQSPPPQKSIDWRGAGTRLEVPWVTLILALSIAIVSFPDVLGYGASYADFLANRYAATRDGEWWRPLSSWLVHLDLEHLVIDLSYLLAVGFLFERRHGGLTLVVVFGLASVLSSWMCVFLDPYYVGALGSSAGTHALVAFFATWHLLREHRPLYVRLSWMIPLAYLTYLGIAGIVTARMGWPFGFFPNCGVDHLGAVLVAALLAVAFPESLARSAARVPQHAVAPIGGSDGL